MHRLRSEAVTWQRVDEEIVCLDLAASQYFAINFSGVVLWEQLAAGADTSALVGTLVSTYDIDESTAQVDVDAFVAMLEARGLLEPA